MDLDATEAMHALTSAESMLMSPSSCNYWRSLYAKHMSVHVAIVSRPIHTLLLCCQVRLAFLQMVADWMLTLRERIDHHARLMPYALSALSDSSKDVQTAALKLMDDQGAQYEEEHQQELKVQLCLSDNRDAPFQ